MQASMRMATATDVQNNFGRYLQYAIENGEVVILRNGKRVARIISEEATVSYLTDSLLGVLKKQYSDGEAKDARIAKYETQE